MNLDISQIQDYIKNMPKDEMYAYAAAFVGLFLVIIALMAL